MRRLENEGTIYKGSIPEVLASSSDKLNVSYNGSSDIGNDEFDIENTCDTSQLSRVRSGG